VKFDQLGRAIFSHEPIGVDAESVNMTERPWDTMTCHCPEEGMQSAWLLAKEVIGRVVCSSSLWDFIGWLWLDAMDEIWE
jgi:hypothetical protein